MKLSVRDLVGGIALTIDDGEKIYNRMYPELRAGRDVELDFAGVEIFASPFFNAAIGQLLKDIRADDLRHNLAVRHLTEDGASVLNRVIENAQRYYSDPRSRAAVDEMLKSYAAEG